jgi:hypothetical protein
MSERLNGSPDGRPKTKYQEAKASPDIVTTPTDLSTSYRRVCSQLNSYNDNYRFGLHWTLYVTGWSPSIHHLTRALAPSF